MSIRYLEIDSTYRDRNRFPNPCDFEIPISQSGVKDKFNAIDPVSLSTPVLEVNSAFNTDIPLSSGINLQVSYGTISQTYIIGEDLSKVVILRYPFPQRLRQEKDFYAGSFLAVDIGGVNEYQRISSYEYLFTTNIAGTDYDYCKITVSSPFSTQPIDGSLSYTFNTSSNDSFLPGSYIFLPLGVEIDNYYINYILEDITIGVSRKIISYEGSTRLAKTESLFPITWNALDSYIVRKQGPSEIGTLSGVTNISLQLPITSSYYDNYYVGDFIRITSGPLYGETRKIIYYNGNTRIATVERPFSSIPGTVTYEILPFTRDNVVPLAFTGMEINKVDNYEIELLNLIIPNKLIISGNGGNAVTYPYLLLEIYNISVASGDTRNILISNNPNSVRVLFRIPVDDTVTKSVSPFVKIDGDGMVQTIKFKPDQSLKFRVLLPNGDVLKVGDSEKFSPSIPNEFMQLSSCFSLRRII
jgi:hypothetical protein